ncbi:LPXTG cell wall anchor domain-containing protein [Micromonospora musae]
MDTSPASDEPESRALPEATVAGDWTILGVITVAIAGLLFWRRRKRRG